MHSVAAEPPWLAHFRQAATNRRRTQTLPQPAKLPSAPYLAAACRYTGLLYRISWMPSQIITHSPEETIAYGRALAAELSPPLVVLLRGSLGAGKTTLVKGLAEGFEAALADDVTSPTFTLIHEYRSCRTVLYHIDLYRIETDRDLETLALDDLVAENSILLIEWGEKFPRLVRDRNIEITLERVGETERRIRRIQR